MKEPSSSSSSQTKPRSFDPSSKPKKNWKPKCFQENDTFWRSSQLEPPPTNYTPGLIPLLRNALLKSHSRGDTRRAILCFAQTVHICREPWDAGWGCGFVVCPIRAHLPLTCHQIPQLFNALCNTYGPATTAFILSPSRRAVVPQCPKFTSLDRNSLERGCERNYPPL